MPDRKRASVKARHYKHQWLSAVLADKTLGYDVRGLLGAIAENIMRADGMNVWAGQRYIAEKCGSSQPTVSRLLAKAIKAGYLVREDRENQYGVMTAHLTPVLPRVDSDVNHDRSESESRGDSHLHQNPHDLNPGDSIQMASAEDGSGSPVSSDPEMALAIIAACGRAVSVEQVIQLWPSDLSVEAAKEISQSVDWGLYFLPDPHLLRLATGIEDAAELAYALAHARECARERLGESLSARQLLLIARRVRTHLDMDSRTAPTGQAASEWSQHTKPVTDPVGFIAGSILTALDQETVKHGG